MFTTRKGKTKQKKSVPVVLSGSLSLALALSLEEKAIEKAARRAQVSPILLFSFRALLQGS